MVDAQKFEPATMTVQGIGIEVIRGGDGPPLVFLHPHIGLDPGAPVLGHLARWSRLVAPSHPGYGRSELPPALTTVDDLAYFYLDFLKELDLRRVVLVGVSLGGWIAAEIAVKATDRLSRLVLADAVGIKVSGPDTRDIVDIFATKQRDFEALAYHGGAPPALDAKTMSEDEIYVAFRNRESTARFAWSPYMYDRKLIHRLHRIDVPTLVLWGASDRVAAPDYGRAYAGAIPGARFELLEGAGHFPHLDQPEAFSRSIEAFAAR